MHKAREMAAVTIGLVEGLLSVAKEAMLCNDYITGQVYAGCAADAAGAALVDFRFYANNTVWPEAADYVGRAETVVETARTISSDCYDDIRNSVRAANKAYADATLNIG